MPPVPGRAEEERRAGTAPLTDIPEGHVGTKGTWNTSVVRVHTGKPIQITMLACPSCGRDISLSSRVIGPDGTVYGSVSCKAECGWKDDVKLVGWEKPLL